MSLSRTNTYVAKMRHSVSSETSDGRRRCEASGLSLIEAIQEAERLRKTLIWKHWAVVLDDKGAEVRRYRGSL